EYRERFLAPGPRPVRLGFFRLLLQLARQLVEQPGIALRACRRLSGLAAAGGDLHRLRTLRALDAASGTRPPDPQFSAAGAREQENVVPRFRFRAGVGGTFARRAGVGWRRGSARRRRNAG